MPSSSSSASGLSAAAPPMGAGGRAGTLSMTSSSSSVSSPVGPGIALSSPAWRNLCREPFVPRQLVTAAGRHGLCGNLEETKRDEGNPKRALSTKGHSMVRRH
jgi:hypothetical protein